MTIIELNNRLLKEGKFDKKGNLSQCKENTKLVKELTYLIDKTKEVEILAVY